MANSILNDVKKMLGMDSEYTAFDQEVIIYINSAISTLTQIGVGPTEGFTVIDDVAEWEDFLAADHRLAAIKNYVYLRVRLIFDPPATSFGITAVENQAKELEWRLQVAAEPVPILDE